MSGWRIAKPEELSRLWPAARSAHFVASLTELEDFYAGGPWRVRVSAAGDAMVLARWRAHLDLLAIRALWVADHRVAQLVAEARAAAHAQGFSGVLSPLLARSLHRPYEAVGMAEIEPIVALQGIPGRIAMRAVMRDELEVRLGRESELERVEAIDAESFDEFWRYGREELETVRTGERLTVAILGGEVVGYATAAIRNSTCTLGRLAVAPQARRAGVGRRLVTDAAMWAATKGAAVFSLCTQESNQASRSLYASCGLFEVEERYGILAIDSA